MIDWPSAYLAPQRDPVGEPPLAPKPEPVREPPTEPLPEQDPPTVPEPAQDPPPGPADEPPPPPVHAHSTDATALIAQPLSAPTVLDEHRLVERVLLELQSQIDGVVEYRLREALTPILIRATDAIVRDARSGLAASLRELVAQSVAQELRRQRTR